MRWKNKGRRRVELRTTWEKEGHGGISKEIAIKKIGEKEVLEPNNTQKEDVPSPYTLPSPSPSKLFNILSGASYE